MTGRNRYFDTYTHALSYGEVCVFISHQKRDAGAARKIADYLTTAGVDVYFDEWDKSIDRSNPNFVVDAIKKGWTEVLLF